jgi:hypothetical protein
MVLPFQSDASQHLLGGNELLSKIFNYFLASIYTFLTNSDFN